jgi:hypothetical protein
MIREESFANVAITLAGIELAHHIRKGQFSFGHGCRRRGLSPKAEWLGTPLDLSNRWRPYAVAMSGDAMRRHPEIDLYVARLLSRRASIPNYSQGGKVWLPLRP